MEKEIKNKKLEKTPRRADCCTLRLNLPKVN